MYARSKLAALLTLASSVALGQTVSAPNSTPTLSIPKEPPAITSLFNRNLVFIDPAHGGGDPGAHLTSQLLEKDVTLALALKLRDALAARGFTVVLARQSDDASTIPATLDDRAGLANHDRPVACILLHATSASHGVQLYTSSLAPVDPDPHMLEWDSAQAAWVSQSLRLANEVGVSLVHANLPALVHRADPKPLSSLTCPALALELSPLAGDDGAATPVNNAGYQQRVVNAVAAALASWKTHADPSPSSDAPETTPAPRPKPVAPRPTPKPTPAPEHPAAAPLPQNPAQANLNKPGKPVASHGASASSAALEATR